jgi:pimeloyl-ACP methyl ester carboxylesterase
MRETIEARDLIVLDTSEGIIRGTYHKPHEDSFRAESHLIPPKSIGVLLMAGLSATRASDGDAAVHWADSFAELGYPSFRLDLLGYGDSDADPPSDWLSFINEGGYASIVSRNIRELMARFNLSGVVIVGHCAGAVSAIYTAAACRDCKGLALLDPYFYLPPAIKQKRIRRRLSLWFLQSNLGGILSKVYGLLKEVRLLLRGNVLPENANISLLRCWGKVASTGLPILILKAPGRQASGMGPRVGEFDYLRYVLKLAGNNSNVVIKMAAGSNHGFSNRLGRVAVRRCIEDWLGGYFPSAAPNSHKMTTLSEPGTTGLGLGAARRV